jgi:hypothetical protein
LGNFNIDQLSPSESLKEDLIIFNNTTFTYHLALLELPDYFSADWSNWSSFDPTNSSSTIRIPPGESIAIPVTINAPSSQGLLQGSIKAIGAEGGIWDAFEYHTNYRINVN